MTKNEIISSMRQVLKERATQNTTDGLTEKEEKAMADFFANHAKDEARFYNWEGLK